MSDDDVTMQTIPRTDPKYALDSRHEAVARVSAGESFTVETHDCRTGTITRPDQVDDLLDARFVNPASGPIAIDGVKAGEGTLAFDRLDECLAAAGMLDGTSTLAAAAPSRRIRAFRA